MKDDNYLMVNGVKIELTDEQIEKLKVDVEKSKKLEEKEKEKEKDLVMFDRVGEGIEYYFVDAEGDALIDTDNICGTDGRRFDIGNYCRDRYPLERKAVLMELVSKMYNHIWVTGGKELLTEKVEKDERIYTVSYDRDTHSLAVDELINYQWLLSFPTRESAHSFIDGNRGLLNKWLMIECGELK